MSPIQDYDPGLINPECDVVESVRHHVNAANANWRDEVDQLERALAEKDKQIAELEHQFAEGDDGETCQDCGRRYDTVWGTDDPTWDRVMGGHTGLLCPMCFDRRCRANGVPIAWYAYTVDIEVLKRCTLRTVEVLLDAERAIAELSARCRDQGKEIAELEAKLAKYRTARKTVLAILDSVILHQTGWEQNEDVMTFNGEPIGGTISSRNNLTIDRWWPELKERLATLITERLQTPRNECEQETEGD